MAWASSLTGLARRHCAGSPTSRSKPVSISATTASSNARRLFYIRHRMIGFGDSWPRSDFERYPLLRATVGAAQMLAVREAVGNYQPPKDDWRSVSVQELIAQERQRS